MPRMQTREEIVEEAARLLAILEGTPQGTLVCKECDGTMLPDDIEDYGRICPCDNDE